MQIVAGNMQAVGQVASHNSMSVGHDDWTKVLNHVNAVELDVWPYFNWLVGHDPNIGGKPLDDYLTLLTEWRTRNDPHPLLTVFIEIKSREGWNTRDFQKILARHFPKAETLFRPSDLRTWASRKGPIGPIVANVGWPTYSDWENRVMFVMNSASEHVMVTYLSEAPIAIGGQTAFGMAEPTATFDHVDEIAIVNDEYDNYSKIINPSQHNFLRRAWKVPFGNHEMNQGNLAPATHAMVDKTINFLAYDDVKNAFSTPV